jgi:AraC-like DNA-binding protein
MKRLSSMLSDPISVISTSARPSSSRPLIWHVGGRTLAAPEKRTLLHALVARIDVRAETVDITVRPVALPATVRPDLDLRRLPLLADTPTTTLSVPAKVKRAGMETKLLIQGTTGPARREPDRSLLRLVGQARRFNDMVLNRRGKTITDLAAEAGVSPSYFTRVYRAAQGEQPTPRLAQSAVALRTL